MKRVRLDDLKAALEQRRPPAEGSESDYKRKLVDEIKRLPGGYARRVEDRFAVGVLDMVLKLPALPLVMAEGKLINGFLFSPTGAQYQEGLKWQAAGIEAVLIGWKARQMFVSPWAEKADCRECFTLPPSQPYHNVLWEYLR